MLYTTLAAWEGGDSELAEVRQNHLAQRGKDPVKVLQPRRLSRSCLGTPRRTLGSRGFRGRLVRTTDSLKPQQLPTVSSGPSVTTLPSAGRMVPPILLEVFVLVFCAEWGDRSQIATVGLAAQARAHGRLQLGLALVFVPHFLPDDVIG